MTEDTGSTDLRRSKRIKTIAAIAGVTVLGVCVAAGVNYAKAGRSPDTGAAVADTPRLATAEQSYALSLPVLDSWIENDFPNSWIAVSNTLEHVAKALEVSSENQEDYAIWVPRFERVVAVAGAVSEGNKAAAKTAFEPLIAEEPGPYADVILDGTLSADPFADAKAALREIDAAVIAEDRASARRHVANTAAALSELVLMMQVELPADTAPKALEQLLPAFHAIDEIQDAVLDGHAKDAAAGSAQLHEELDNFQTWQGSNDS